MSKCVSAYLRGWYDDCSRVDTSEDLSKLPNLIKKNKKFLNYSLSNIQLNDQVIVVNGDKAFIGKVKAVHNDTFDTMFFSGFNMYSGKTSDEKVYAVAIVNEQRGKHEDE